MCRQVLPRSRMHTLRFYSVARYINQSGEASFPSDFLPDYTYPAFIERFRWGTRLISKYVFDSHRR